MKILIVDDEDDIRTIARLALTRVGGMDVREAGSGPDGVRQAAAERPDGILLDVMMPGMDGPSTLAELQKNAATESIPVVFLTSKAMASEVDRLHALGARGVLIKPFDPMTLASELRAILSRD